MSPDHPANLSRREVLRMVRGQAVLMLVLLGFVFFQSYNGRLAIHDADYTDCLHVAEARYRDVLVLRAQATGDQAIADDPDQPASTRDARRAQAAAERASLRIKEKLTAPTVEGRKAFCHDNVDEPSPLG